MRCGCAFIEADVIRFTESVWEKAGRRRSEKSMRIGEREVIAEVTGDDGEWVHLRVLRSEATWKLAGCERRVRALAKGLDTRRKRRTITRKDVYRLPWSDESVRDLVKDRSG